jgi:hypothetical protein
VSCEISHQESISSTASVASLVSVRSISCTCSQKKNKQTEPKTNLDSNVRVEVQTDVAGIDGIFTYSQPVPESYEVLIGTDIEIEQLIEHEVYAPDTISDLVCCKCRKDDSTEKLSKCHSASKEKLTDLCRLMGLGSVLDAIEEQWKSGRLRIHHSCRQSLHNESRKYSKER